LTVTHDIVKIIAHAEGVEVDVVHLPFMIDLSEHGGMQKDNGLDLLPAHLLYDELALIAPRLRFKKGEHLSHP